MLEKAKSWISKTLAHLELEFSKIQLGRANPSLIEDLMIEQYWTMQTLKSVASINVMDGQTLSVKPWDKTILQVVAKSISDSGMWLNPQTMADSILIKVPALTEERRRDIVKIVKKLTEEAKVWVRNARLTSHKLISKAKEEKQITEDEARDLDEDLQKIVDDSNKTIDELSQKKQDDIMKI